MLAIESEEVFLEPPAVPAQLLSARPDSSCRGAGRPALQPSPALPRQSGPRRAQSVPREEPGRTGPYSSRVCSRGVCNRCHDNFWRKRIFDEKLADPSYYGHISARHNSSLAGV
jgi:hypothetical protein